MAECAMDEQTRGEAGRMKTAARSGAPRSRWRRAIRRVYAVGRAGLALAMLCQIALLGVVVFTPVTERVLGWLDVTEGPAPADAILCLGGRDRRLIWAADLFRREFAPVVIVSNKYGAAYEMRSIITQFGVPPECVRVDAAACTTSDHPSSIAAMPGIEPGTQRFLIVTDQDHSRRVAACFRNAGYQHFRVYAGRSVGSVVPPERDQRWRARILRLPVIGYECAALLKYWFQGKI
jgi:uncharacterized SAM-binding protein YcdF (DUF218 family)